MEDTTPITDNGLPRITCGCGFTVSGEDETNNRLAYEDHDCPNVDTGQNHWYAHVFSFNGVLILAVVAWAVATIVTHGKG